MEADANASLMSQYPLVPPVSIAQLPDQGVNNTTYLVQSQSGCFISKHYASFDDLTTLRYEHQLLRWLAAQRMRFAVPEPLSARDGATLTAARDGWQALFPYLPGSAPDRNSTEVAQAAGAALAELHAALAAYPLDARPGMPGYRDLATIHPRIADPWLLSPALLGLPDDPALDDLLACWREELAALRPEVERVYPILPRQVIHGDFTLANTLFEGDRLTAILDFEFAGPDARALDIAAGLSSTLHVQNDSNDLQLAEAFCCGYGSRTRLTQQEVEALPVMIHQREAVSTTWWLGRDLSAGNTKRPVDRINSFCTLSGWLDQHTSQLVERIAPFLA